jgi:hypothetical protein
VDVADNYEVVSLCIQLYDGMMSPSRGFIMAQLQWLFRMGHILRRDVTLMTQQLINTPYYPTLSSYHSTMTDHLSTITATLCQSFSAADLSALLLATSPPLLPVTMARTSPIIGS